MAFENIIGAKLEHRWVAAFGFGWCTALVSPSSLATPCNLLVGTLFSSLLAFNVGVELGQILVLILVIPGTEYTVSQLRQRAHRYYFALGIASPQRLALDAGSWQFSWAIPVADADHRFPIFCRADALGHDADSHRVCALGNV